MLDSLFFFIASVFTFFVKSFVFVVSPVVSVVVSVVVSLATAAWVTFKWTFRLKLFYKLWLYFLKVINFIAWVIPSTLYVLPFVLLDNVVNAVSFFAVGFFDTLKFGIKMFVSFLISTFADYFVFFLLPETLITVSAMLALVVYVRAIARYNTQFFFNELASHFGVSRINSLMVGTYEYDVLIRFHNTKKRLTAIFQAWWLAFLVMIFSFLWMFVSVTELFSVRVSNLPLNGGFESVKVGLSDPFFGQSFYHDGFSHSSRLFILSISIIFMIMVRFEVQNDSRLRRIEFLFLFLIGTVFSMLMVAASGLLSLFLAVEGLVMVMYVLTAGSSVSLGFPIVKLLRFRAVEGALKYAVTNAMATSFFLVGALLLFLLSGGHLDLLVIRSILVGLTSGSFNSSSDVFILLGLSLGTLLICLTFLFKLGIAPFHNWMADLYEASVPGVLAYFLIVPKAAVFFTFLNISRFLFIPLIDFFSWIFFVFGIISIVIGSVHALEQIKIERLLAYSSVVYSGAFLILLGAVPFLGGRPFQLIIFFVIAYVLVNASFLSVYLGLRYSKTFFSHSYIRAFKIFSTLTATAQRLVTVVFFNLAGLPPFLGWFLKALVVLVLIKLFFVGQSAGVIDVFFNFDFKSLFISPIEFFSSLGVSAQEIWTFTVANFLEKFGFVLSLQNYKIVLFARSFVFAVSIFFILLVFLMLVISTFYYVRLLNTMNSNPASSPVLVEKQGLLVRISLDLSTLILILFFINVSFLFFFNSVLSFIGLFFIKFSIGF